MSKSSLDSFTIVKTLGEGSYSVVFNVIRKEDQKEYALKKVRMAGLSDKEKENAINEVRILASVKSENVISYKEAFIDESSESLCIIMEYANNGDLF
jgi:NIMA (never in mitosis gene a)-related kinase